MTAIVTMKIKGFTRKVLVDKATGEFIWDIWEEL